MFYLVHAGNELQLVTNAGDVIDLPLPASGLLPSEEVSVSQVNRARFGVLGGAVVVVNAPSENLWFDPLTKVLRPVGILPPLHPPALNAKSASGSLEGEFRARVSYAIKDENGVVINESPLSGQSMAVELTTSDQLEYNEIPISPNPHVNCRRVYRTKAGGTIFFRAFDLDDNVITGGIVNQIPDAALDRLPADPALGNPPGTMPGGRLTNIIEWNRRLWAVPSQYDLRDHVFYTEEDLFYAWPAVNDFRIPPAGEDEFGILGFLRRRDALGILKRKRIMKIVGSSNDDFEVLTVVEDIGCIAPESCVVIRDVGYFLAEDGVYAWSDEGVVCISRAAVDPWFTTDTYFNRAEFPRAVGAYNSHTNAYELCLAAAASPGVPASDFNDRWVSFHIDKQEWLGPHLTEAVHSPTSRALLRSDENALRPAIGCDDSHIYLQNQAVPSDVAAAPVAIPSIAITKWHALKSPNADHHWGMLALLSQVEVTPMTLTISPQVGYPFQSASLPDLTHNLQLGRQEVGRIATSDRSSSGFLQLWFRQQTAGAKWLLYGYEIEEAHDDGVR